LEKRRSDLKVDAHSQKIYYCGKTIKSSVEKGSESDDSQTEHEEEDEEADSVVEEEGDIFEDDVVSNALLGLGKCIQCMYIICLLFVLVFCHPLTIFCRAFLSRMV
jgi:hypothetical protein